MKSTNVNVKSKPTQSKSSPVGSTGTRSSRSGMQNKRNTNPNMSKRNTNPNMNQRGTNPNMSQSSSQSSRLLKAPPPSPEVDDDRKMSTTLDSFQSSFTSFFTPTLVPKKSIMVRSSAVNKKRDPYWKRAIKNPCGCFHCRRMSLPRWCIIVAVIIMLIGLLKLIELDDMPIQGKCVNMLKNRSVTRNQSAYADDEANEKCYGMVDGMITTIVFFTVASVTAAVFLLCAIPIYIPCTIWVCLLALLVAVVSFASANAVLFVLAPSRRLPISSKLSTVYAVAIERTILLTDIFIIFFLYIYFGVCAWALKLQWRATLNFDVKSQTTNKLPPRKVQSQKKAFFRNRDNSSVFGKRSSTAPMGRAKLSTPQRLSVVRRSSSELQRYEAMRRPSPVPPKSKGNI